MSKGITLPKGSLVWPKLNDPDDFKGKKQFKTNVKFSDEDHRKVDAWLKKTAAELGHPKANLPWKKDKKTGEISLYVHSGEKKPPAIMDSKGTELPRRKFQVGGGSIARINVFPKWYDVQGADGSLTLYMGFVQLLKFVPKQKFAVEAEEGFTYEGGDDDEDDGEAGAPETPSDIDDDIPF